MQRIHNWARQTLAGPQRTTPATTPDFGTMQEIVDSHGPANDLRWLDCSHDSCQMNAPPSVDRAAAEPFDRPHRFDANTRLVDDETTKILFLLTKHNLYKKKETNHYIQFTGHLIEKTNEEGHLTTLNGHNGRIDVVPQGFQAIFHERRRRAKGRVG